MTIEKIAAEVAAVCDAAGDRIERYGLAKGVWHMPDGSACLIGAIQLESPSRKLRSLTIVAVVAHLDMKEWWRASNWSDNVATQEQVVQVFRDVAASLRPQRYITIDVDRARESLLRHRPAKLLYADPRVVIPAPQRERQAVAV